MDFDPHIFRLFRIRAHTTYIGTAGLLWLRHCYWFHSLDSVVLSVYILPAYVEVQTDTSELVRLVISVDKAVSR